MRHTWAPVFLAVCMTVNAALWPTRPIQSTVFRAGRTEKLEWSNNDKSPSLEDLGELKVELWNNQTFLYTLATGVDATARSHNVTIESSLNCNGHHFHIRFISEIPREIVYTGDFTIESDGTDTFNDAAAFASATGTSAQSMPSSTPVSGVYTPSLDLAATAFAQPPTGSDEWTTVTLTSQPQDIASATSDKSDSESVHSSSSASGNSRRPQQGDAALFRSVFVMWPVLVGVALAL